MDALMIERVLKSDKEDKKGKKEMPTPQVQAAGKKWKIKHIGNKPDKTYHTRGMAKVDKPLSSQKYLHLKVEKLEYSSLYGFSNSIAITKSSFEGKPTNTNGTVAVRALRLSRFFANIYVDNKTYFVPFLQL
ncbi:hypothetical protein ACFE04_017290 [Oxalis oulophora]